MIIIMSQLDIAPSMNAKHHHAKKRTHIFPSQFCVHSHIQWRNDFLFQDTSFMYLKKWTIPDILCFHFLAIIKHIIIWLLRHFQSTLNSTCTCLKNGYSRCSHHFYIITTFLVDCFLDSLDNLGDQFPVLRTITPFNIEELVEISLAIAYYIIVGFNYVLKKF